MKWADAVKDRVLFAFCIPSLGTVSLAFAQTLRSIVLPMNTAAIPVFVLDEVGGEVAECRNKCVQIALHRKATHLFWLDDDVCTSERALISLYHHRRDIASGVYFTKDAQSEPLIFPAKGGGTAPFLAEGTTECWAAGMGLCLIKAEVYRRMELELKLPKDKYGNIQFYKTVEPEEATLDENLGTVNYGSTEDFFFFDLAAKLGHKVLMDHSRAAFGWHVENKSPFRGYPQEQYHQDATLNPVVWQTPNGVKTWDNK